MNKKDCSKVIELDIENIHTRISKDQHNVPEYMLWDEMSSKECYQIALENELPMIIFKVQELLNIEKGIKAALDTTENEDVLKQSLIKNKENCFKWLLAMYINFKLELLED